MPRPTAAAVLLVGAAVTRAAAVASPAAAVDLDLRALVLASDVLVPTVIAVADWRRVPAAAPAASPSARSAPGRC